jgi:ABC-2 type transport system permease protein
MKMFSALLRTRLSALAAYFIKSSRRKNKGKGMTVLFTLLMIYAFGCIAFMIGMLYHQLYNPLSGAGLKWFYFAIAGIMTFALCFIGTVFMAQVQIYGAKDNDLLLSMPIPPRYILVTRMLLLLFLSYVFEIVSFIPSVVIYYYYETFTVLSLVYFIVIFLILPLLSVVLSCIVGWLVAIISSRMRNKSLITMILSLAFLGVYFYGYSKVTSYIQMLIANGAAIADTIKRVLPPAYYLGMAIEKLDIISLLIFLAWCILPMVVLYLILNRSFIKIATTKRGFAKVQYKEKAMKVSSARSALIKKDLKHFVTSPVYMMNGALGIIFEIALAVALVIKVDLLTKYTAEVPALKGAMGPVAILALCIISSMNIISASSISLEGKNLWICQSIPVDGSQVLVSKALMHMTVTVPPVVLSSIICAIALKVTPVMALLLLAVPVLMNIFCALLGVAVNLKFPKFDWINETVVVKQSASPMICMFGGAAVVVAPMLIYMYLASDIMSVEAFTGLFGALLAVISLLLYWYLMKGGNRAFKEL